MLRQPNASLELVIPHSTLSHAPSSCLTPLGRTNPYQDRNCSTLSCMLPFSRIKQELPMDATRLKAVLEAVKTGKLSTDEALDRLKVLPFEELGFATLDSHRSLRQGFPEVLFCPGKTIEQITAIAERLLRQHGSLLATRASEEGQDAIDHRDHPGDERRDRRHPGRRGGEGDRRVLRKPGRKAVRCRGCRTTPDSQQMGRAPRGPGPRCGGGNGWRPSPRGGGAPGPTADRRSHEHRLRGELRGHVGASHHAQFLRRRHGGGGHRQRLWGRRARPPDQPPRRTRLECWKASIPAF